MFNVEHLTLYIAKSKIKGIWVANVPTLRFPGFTDEWETLMLSEIAPNISAGRSGNPIENGDFHLYGSTGIIGKTNNAQYQGEKILIARVGANAGKISYNNETCGITDNTLIVKSAKISARYLYYYLTRYNLNRLIFGSGQPLITGGMLKKIPIPFPEPIERNKIISFLSLIDKRIALQSKLIEDLKKLKSAIRAAIFQQLKKTTNQMRAGAELLEYEQPTKYLVSGTEYSQDKSLTPVLTANKSLILGYTDEKFGIYKKGDCIILDDFTLDLKYITFPFKVKSSAIKILRAKNGVSLRYMYEYLNWLELTPLGHNRHYISMIEPMQFYCPEVQAQEKIATTLEKADEKIQSESRLFDALTRQKYYLLSAMFI